MKLSFTTLGCPKWDLDQIISRAAEYGFDGMDFRGIREQMEIYRLPEFAEHAQETRRKIEQAGLKVSCFSSSVYLFSTEKREQHVHEIEQYAAYVKRSARHTFVFLAGKSGRRTETSGGYRRSACAETRANCQAAWGEIAVRNPRRLDGRQRCQGRNGCGRPGRVGGVMGRAPSLSHVG